MSAADGGTAPTIKARRSFGEQMREFPWWAVIIITFLIGAFIYMITDPSYRNALSFIAFPPTETEIAFGLEVRNGLMMTLYTTVIAYLIALILGLILGIMRGLAQPDPVSSQHDVRGADARRADAGADHLDRLRGGALPAQRDRQRLDHRSAGRADRPGLRLRGLPGRGLPVGHRVRSPAGRWRRRARWAWATRQAMRHVVLPQAIRRVLPPLSNDLVAMLKDSALVSVVAVPDILQMARLYVSRTFRAFEGYNSVAFLYLVMTLLFIIIVRMIERRWRASV